MDFEYQIRIAGIELSDVSVVRRPTNIDLSNFIFDIAIHSKIDYPQSLIIVEVHSKIKSSSGDIILGNFQTACAFEVENFQNYVQLNENQLYHIPDSLENVLRTVAVGTSRGIIFSEVKGSYLQNAIMPILIFPGKP